MTDHGPVIRVVHILRPEKRAYSIEKVFQEVRDNINPSKINIETWVCPYPSRGIIPRILGAWSASKLSADVYHVTGDVHYLSIFLPRKKTLLTIHDCEFVRRATGAKKLLLWCVWLKIPVAVVKLVTTISESSQSDILRYTKCAQSKVMVIENPVSNKFLPSPLRGISSAVIKVLQIGTKPNKNLENLVKACQGLPVSLVIIGVVTPQQQEMLDSADFEHICYQNLTDEEVYARYEDCDLVAFCSFSEGFGVPIVEAQRVGRPVITSNLEPMLSVAGRGALFVDPNSIQEIREALDTLIRNGELRNELVAAGRQNALRFDSEGIAEKYSDLYFEIHAAGSE
jgi:glycosyltransferase involved in cell wall biosynthesis